MYFKWSPLIFEQIILIFFWIGLIQEVLINNTVYWSKLIPNPNILNEAFEQVYRLQRHVYE